MEISENELRSGRHRLAVVLINNGFAREVTPQTVSSLTKVGFNIGGYMGAQFNINKGLSVWNRGQRATGASFTVSELSNLEAQLRDEFESIWMNFS